jgi:hypothetical protein
MRLADILCDNDDRPSGNFDEPAVDQATILPAKNGSGFQSSGDTSSNKASAEAIKYLNAPILLAVSQLERLSTLLGADRLASLLFGLNMSASAREAENDHQLSNSAGWQTVQGSPVNSIRTQKFGTNSADLYVDCLFARMCEEGQNLSYKSRLEVFLRKRGVLPPRYDSTKCNMQVRFYF